MTDRVERNSNETGASQSQRYYVPPAAVELPKGGGAIRGIGEKFSVNPTTGTGSLTIPIFTTPGRSSFHPQLSISYDSGAGNGVFGLGWNLSIPSITRKTEKGLPRYRDGEDSDVFILSGAEDLVPVLKWDGDVWTEDHPVDSPGAETYDIRRYRPRIEGLFARIERWQDRSTGAIHWRSISKDNVTSIYGRSSDQLHSQIADPANDFRVFKWLLEASYDDRGNLIVYEYKSEDDANVDPAAVQEGHREAQDYGANVYLKRIWYGNRTPYRQATNPPRKDYLDIIQDGEDNWLFQVVFDYGEHGITNKKLQESDKPGLDEGNWNGLTPADLSSDNPRPDEEENQLWPYRLDAFSTYRAGFEVRTQRLCRRVLMFHRMNETGELEFDRSDDPPLPVWHLVRSTDFGYEKDPVATYLVAAKQTGYVREGTGYRRRWMPPLEMHYDRPAIHGDIQTIDPESLENLPIGLDGRHYQWVDLDNEGISGILTNQGTGWFYKRNLGLDSDLKTVTFGPLERVASMPSVAVLQSPQQRVMDLAGDGTQDIVLLGAVTGYYQRESDGEWRNFQLFESTPNVDWNDPNLRFIDLNGDGHADILIAQDELFVWYPSQARQGFGVAETVRKAQDEAEGPALVFADGTQSVYLADMSGDGLNDLVRIRNGQVCYWPSLGYGRFGARVTMDGAPWFDHPELFDQKRVRLADIDGSGTTDILYLGREDIAIWLNQAGNGWSEPQRLTSFPTVDDLAAVQAIDLLGNGTACLVWSSPLPGPGRQPMRYIDLMGGQKPHLMTSVVNNLGAETKLQYAASTKFYLADRKAGNPWITRLPFPVHVVERVETIDHLTENRFVSLYRYRHGYFDGEEREFRGFGLVEQWDTEEYEKLAAGNLFTAGTNEQQFSHVPPVYTKTWFHTGCYRDREHISQLFAEEYYQGDDQAVLLPDTLLPTGITLTNGTERNHQFTAEEEREACRALKGTVLRQEVYGLDGTEKATHPYTVTESSSQIRMLQPTGGNRHGVFFVLPRESLAYHYERDPKDPRVAHEMTLEVDGFGNGLKSVSIAYPRRNPAHSEQGKTYITYTENKVTNRPNESDWYRIGLPVETSTYELTGAKASGSRFFSLDDFYKKDEEGNLSGYCTASDIPYETIVVSEDKPKKRLIEKVRILYKQNSKAHSLDPLPEAETNSIELSLLELGTIQSLALPYETYKLAFTKSLLDQVFTGRAVDQQLLSHEGRYVSSQYLIEHKGFTDKDSDETCKDSDETWWIPSGRQAFNPDLFYLPTETKDPFGQSYTISYDEHALLVQETVDPLGNRVTIGERDSEGIVRQWGNNYRVMQPEKITDPNGNRAEVAFNILGLVVGTAIMGKVDGPEEGDSLDGFIPDLNEKQIKDFLRKPLKTAVGLLGPATTRIIYDLEQYQRSGKPAVVATLARKIHESDLHEAMLQSDQVQVSFLYSDGFGRELQSKIQAEPEDRTHSVQRWVGTGRTVYNNKGKPVKQYEPFFCATHDYETEDALVEGGVTPILFYDPLERVVATLHPNHTYEKVVFNPWSEDTWDVNDTVVPHQDGDSPFDPKNDSDVGLYFQRLPEEDYLPTWYDWRINPSKALEKWPDFDAKKKNPLPANEHRRATEKSAALKAAAHARTPARSHLDTLGRSFLSVAHNGWDKAKKAEKAILYKKRIEQDIEGQTLKVIDARGNAVMTYSREVSGGPKFIRGYDVLGNELYTNSMDAGERWILNDVAGNPIRSWDSRGHYFRYRYDELRRPIESWVKGADEKKPNREILFEKTEYGEKQSKNIELNLRTQVYRQWDGAGLITQVAYDFKGNLLRSRRQLATEYRTTPDWSDGPDLLEKEIFESSTLYDALNRSIQMIAPHDVSDQRIQGGHKLDIIQHSFNEANLLESIDVWFKYEKKLGQRQILNGQEADLHAVVNIDYDAKGQRTAIEYGVKNEQDEERVVRTTYKYDLETFRLVHLWTQRDRQDFGGDCPKSQSKKPKSRSKKEQWLGCGLQSLYYTYDPAGNITHIRDDAQQKIFFMNQRIDPDADYTYDAIYRLIEATGREHLGQKPNDRRTPISHDDSFRMNRPHPNDEQAMGRYTQRYVYDEVGNILEMIHGKNDTQVYWRRCYQYALDSNRLLSTRSQENPMVNCPTSYAVNPIYKNKYSYDTHGNINGMHHLPVMGWDFQDQLQRTARQSVKNGGKPEMTYYVYDADGQRVRKVTDRSLTAKQIKEGRKIRPLKERLYLGEFEIYREYDNPKKNFTLERETLHVMDDEQRVALIEIRTHGIDSSAAKLIRYQLGNHLTSASLELNEKTQVITYEEYSPYGSTVYQAVKKNIKASTKRYRYTGKERDEESGFNYHGARYYTPWLGRWMSCDPYGLEGGNNLYQYAFANPISLNDASGLKPNSTNRHDENHLTPDSSPDKIKSGIYNDLRQDRNFKDLTQNQDIDKIIDKLKNEPWFRKALNLHHIHYKKGNKKSGQAAHGSVPSPHQLGMRDPSQWVSLASTGNEYEDLTKAYPNLFFWHSAQCNQATAYILLQQGISGFRTFSNSSVAKYFSKRNSLNPIENINNLVQAKSGDVLFYLKKSERRFEVAPKTFVNLGEVPAPTYAQVRWKNRNVNNFITQHHLKRTGIKISHSEIFLGLARVKGRLRALVMSTRGGIGFGFKLRSVSRLLKKKHQLQVHLGETQLTMTFERKHVKPTSIILFNSTKREFRVLGR